MKNIIVLIQGHNVTVASAGDCVAVVGSYGENGAWLSKKMNDEHNADNRTEVKRILAEHPDTESHTIIRQDSFNQEFQKGGSWERAYRKFKYYSNGLI